MQRARIILGAHGAGLANCLWARRGTALVELPVYPLQPSTFSHLAAALGLEYWVVPEVSATQTATYHVTPPAITAVISTLRAILSGTDHVPS